MAKKLDIRNLNDWYNVSLSSLSRVDECGLINQSTKLSTILPRCYPEVSWEMWKLSPMDWRTNTEPSNVRKFFDRIGNLLGIKKLENWYSKRPIDLKKLHQEGWITSSPSYEISDLVKLAYPEHEWLPWFFNRHVKDWDNIDVQKRYLLWLGDQLFVKVAYSSRGAKLMLIET